MIGELFKVDYITNFSQFHSYSGWLRNPAPVGHMDSYGLSPDNPIIYNVSYYKPIINPMFHSYLTVANWCRISSTHPQ